MSVTQQVRDALGDLDHDSVAEGPVLVSETDGEVRLILGPLSGGSRLAEDQYHSMAVQSVAADAGNRLAAAGLVMDVDAFAAGAQVRVERR